MQVRIGGYLFPAGGVNVDYRVQVVDDARGVPSSERHVLTLTGSLIPTSTAGTTSQQLEIQSQTLELERAVRRVKLPDVLVFRDDGGFAFGLRNVGSLNGVKRREGPSYPNSDGAEYVNYRTFVLVFEAEYPILAGGGGSILVAFREVVAFRGGGPVRGWSRPVNAPPIRQTLYTHSPFEAVQQGTATALGTWPVPPGPIWPALRDTPLDGGEPSFESPQQGPRGVQFTVAWNYRFSSDRPFTGRPNLWIGSG